MSFATVVVKRAADRKRSQKSKLTLGIARPGIVAGMPSEHLIVPQCFGANQFMYRRSWLGRIGRCFAQGRAIDDVIPKIGQAKQRDDGCG